MHRVKFLLFTLLCVAGVLTGKSASQTARPISILDGATTVNEPNISIDGSDLRVVMIFNFSSLNVQREESYTLYPKIITDEGKTIPLDTIVIMGQKAYDRLARRKDKTTLQSEHLLVGGHHRSMLYNVTVPLSPGSTVGSIVLTACKFQNINSRPTEYPEVKLCNYRLSEPLFSPTFIYAVPDHNESKQRESTRIINISFNPGEATINPKSMLNGQELDSIKAFVKRVLQSRHKIESIVIRASSSPGLVDKKERNIRGMRADAIGAYLAHSFPALSELISTDVTDDNWAAVARWLKRSSISNKDSITAIVTDRNIPESLRMTTLRRRYPEETKFMQDVIFPVLENISLNITTSLPRYSSLSEIEKVYKSHREDLSAYELCRYCERLHTMDVTKTADVTLETLRLWPDSPEACINAANVYMSRNDLNTARILLYKAGESAAAYYARGNLEAMSGDYDRAIRYFNTALQKGLPESETALKSLHSIVNF